MRKYFGTSLLLAAMLAACKAPSGNPAATTGTTSQTTTAAASSSVQAAVAAPKAVVTQLSGVAVGPLAAVGTGDVKTVNGVRVLVGSASHIISNDGSTLISQDGGGIVAQGGGNLISQDGSGIVAQGGGNAVAKQLHWYGTLATDAIEQLPMAGAVVTARDALTMELLPTVKASVTDATGHFALSGVPADVTVIVDVLFVGDDGKGLHESSMAHTAPQATAATPRPVQVSLDTTLAVATVVKAANGNRDKVRVLSQDEFDKVTATLTDAMTRHADQQQTIMRALAVSADAQGHVTVAEHYSPDDFKPMAAPVQAIAAADPVVAQATQAIQVAVDAPVTPEDQSALQQARLALSPMPVLASPTQPPAGMPTTTDGGTGTPSPVPTGALSPVASLLPSLGATLVPSVTPSPGETGIPSLAPSPSATPVSSPTTNMPVSPSPTWTPTVLPTNLTISPSPTAILETASPFEQTTLDTQPSTVSISDPTQGTLHVYRVRP